MIKKETIKDNYLGTYQDVYKGEASPAQLFKALQEAEENLEEFDKDDWYEKFKHQLMGLDQGRVESAAWFLEQQKDKAFANLEDVEAAKAALQEVRDFLEPVDRSRLDPAVKVGEMQVNYQEEYDNVLAAVDQAEKEFSDMAAIVRRAPPASPKNLIEGDEDLWEEEGSIEVTIAMGSMVLESPQGGENQLEISILPLPRGLGPGKVPIRIPDQSLRNDAHGEIGSHRRAVTGTCSRCSPLHIGVCGEVTPLFALVVGKHPSRHRRCSLGDR